MSNTQYAALPKNTVAPTQNQMPIGEAAVCSNPGRGEGGFCFVDPNTYDCGMCRLPDDTSAHCSDNCNYVATPPYGCIWDSGWNRCNDNGCGANPGYACVSYSPGSCQCVTQEQARSWWDWFSN